MNVRRPMVLVLVKKDGPGCIVMGEIARRDYTARIVKRLANVLWRTRKGKVFLDVVVMWVSPYLKVYT